MATVRGTSLALPASRGPAAINISLEIEDTMKSMGSIARANGALGVVVCSARQRRQALPRCGRRRPRLADRAKRAGEVLSELTSVPDRSPPKALLNEAVCVAVVPGVVQAGFGNRAGRAGFRSGELSHRHGWSWPAFVGLKGRPAFGPARSARSRWDVVLIFINGERGRARSQARRSTIGGEVSVGRPVR